jgi:hypothetical protein
VSAFDLGCLVVAARALRRMRQEELSLGATLTAALQVSLNAVERQMRDCRLFGCALAIEAACEIGGAWLFYLTGNLPRHGFLTKLALATVVVTAIAATLRRYYRHQLRPRLAELRRQIAEVQPGRAEQ